ncbi:hypothetical protein J8273_4075 [Carpediemonas membranifera]|uniref:Integrase catalytic domain-containing protein n=1 Tax=Carpediemonas membranifera TaxID=201153 RepID=A0A8J6E297_9EUKA|nr:hypothetical protein J8273_4075 [Carpediemonas membranifera]|eukprot:KAG9394418.1 hypothetical protein J8273_4075 [Carpediemonas membranifera]
MIATRFPFQTRPAEIAEVTANTLESRVLASQKEHADERPSKHTIVNGVVKYHGRTFVPADARRDVLAEAHRLHLGVKKTAQAVRDLGYDWPQLEHTVSDLINACLICQKTRLANFIKLKMGATPSSTPFERVAVDTLGPISEDSAGNRYVVVITDTFTHFTELVPAPSNNADAAAAAIWASICRHGIPAILHTDGGPEYANRIITALTERLSVTHHRTTPFHPQSNGHVERVNREIKRHLRTLALAFNSFDAWSTTLLPYVAWIINSTVHSATGFTPFELLYGTHAADRQIPQPDNNAEDETPLTSVAEYLTVMDALLAKLCRKAHKRQSKTREGRAETQSVPVKPGDYVLRKNHAESKLHGHTGPFKVIEVNPFTAVVVPLLANEPRRTVHLSHLIQLKSDLS